MPLRSWIADRVEQLPPRPRRAVRRALRQLPVSRGWVYDADGLATVHFSPFLEDAEFSRLYDRMAADWFRDEVVDARWRMWLLTRYALQAHQLPGNYAEFGVYRGGCSSMLLATARLEPHRRLHLFDTFEGIPRDEVSEREQKHAGTLSDTSAEYVARLLAPWDPIPQLWPGDVFDTIPATDTGPLAFVHLDLNIAAPTRHVLDHIYDRLVPGAIVLFDDYGWHEYEDQRRVIDDVLLAQPEVLIALPTGQAMFTKALS